MSTARRRVTVALSNLLSEWVPTWGAAIAREAACIDDDAEALWFVIDAARGLLPRLVLQSPRLAGVVCAVSAVLCGLGYLWLAGAPARHLGVNSGALLLGLVGSALIARTLRPWPSGLTALLASGLLLTAALGLRIEGAARWVLLGGLVVQPSLVVLPVVILAFARARDWLSTFGVAFTACALALQPDRAMSAVLAASMAALTVFERDRYSVSALSVSMSGLLLAMVQPDALPAMPWVDQIFFTAFAVSPLAGLCVVGGSALLVAPALIRVERPVVRAVFATTWLVMIAAAALGNYPTPVVGYSGGAVLGYVLSLSMLSGLQMRRPTGTRAAADDQPQRNASHFRVAGVSRSAWREVTSTFPLKTGP